MLAGRGSVACSQSSTPRSAMSLSNMAKTLPSHSTSKIRNPEAVRLMISITEDAGSMVATLLPLWSRAVAITGSRSLKRLPISMKLSPFSCTTWGVSDGDTSKLTQIGGQGASRSSFSERLFNHYEGDVVGLRRALSEICDILQNRLLHCSAPCRSLLSNNFQQSFLSEHFF